MSTTSLLKQNAGTRQSQPAMFYQPEARMLVVDFPRRGAYLYHNVPVHAYETLRRSAGARACFLEDNRRHYSIVASW